MHCMLLCCFAVKNWDFKGTIHTLESTAILCHLSYILIAFRVAGECQSPVRRHPRPLTLVPAVAGAGIFTF